MIEYQAVSEYESTERDRVVADESRWHTVGYLLVGKVNPGRCLQLKISFLRTGSTNNAQREGRYCGLICGGDDCDDMVMMMMTMMMRGDDDDDDEGH